MPSGCGDHIPWVRETLRAHLISSILGVFLIRPGAENRDPVSPFTVSGLTSFHPSVPLGTLPWGMRLKCVPWSAGGGRQHFLREDWSHQGEPRIHTVDHGKPLPQRFQTQSFRDRREELYKINEGTPLSLSLCYTPGPRLCSCMWTSPCSNPCSRIIYVLLTYLGWVSPALQ